MNSIEQTPTFVGIPSTSRVVAIFTIDGEPASKARPRFDHRGSKSHVYTPAKTKAAEARVAQEFLKVAKKKGSNPETTYGVSAHFYSGTRQRRDVDNMLKLVLDGLNGLAFPDDVQVIEVTGRKSIVSRTDARTEVTVYEIGEMDRLTKECVYCGSDFVTWPSLYEKTKYCSAECRENHRVERRKVECQHCGKQFLSHGESAARTAKFCSKKCMNEAAKVDVTCIVCGTTVRKRKSSKAQNYCSQACTKKDYRKRQKALGVGAGTCETCGGPVSRKEYRQCQSCAWENPLPRRTKEVEQ